MNTQSKILFSSLITLSLVSAAPSFAKDLSAIGGAPGVKVAKPAKDTKKTQAQKAGLEPAGMTKATAIKAAADDIARKPDDMKQKGNDRMQDMQRKAASAGAVQGKADAVASRAAASMAVKAAAQRPDAAMAGKAAASKQAAVKAAAKRP